MSNISEEKLKTQKKLEMLRENKRKREQQNLLTSQPVESGGKKPANVDAILNDLLKSKEKKEDNYSIGTASPEKSPIKTSPMHSLPKKQQKLSFNSKVLNVFIEGQEKYDREVQTTGAGGDITLSTPRRSTAKGVAFSEPIVEEDSKTLALPKAADRRITKLDATMLEESKEKVELTESEIKGILNSKDFHNFFNWSTKIIEKNLESKEPELLEDLLNNAEVEEKDALKGDALRHFIKFFDGHFSTGRAITALEWSPNIDSLLLAAYSENEEGNIDDPVGVVLLWSLALKNRPEFHCFCQSAVTACRFHPYSNNLLLGGLYNGQLVVWDLRAKSYPVQRTTMSSGGHTYPIYALDVIGSQKAHNIVTISNDGKLCSWNLNMLSSPNKVVDLKSKVSTTTKQMTEPSNEINVTCMKFPPEDPNNFYIGSEDGTLYWAQIHGNQMKGDNVVEKYEGHQAPVTSLSIFPQVGDASSNLAGLMLSSSFDWSVKMWNPKISNDPIYTFESAEDYVYDVAWNPANPTLFSAVDGEGYVDIWDICNDKEMPRCHYKGGDAAINKAIWNKDGSKILTGDAVGNINIYQLDKRLLKTSPEKLLEFENAVNQIASGN